MIRNRLIQLQQTLELTDSDVDSIEARLTSQLESLESFEKGKKQKPQILSPKWRRRGVLLVSTALGLVLTSFAPCNTPQLIVGIAVILIGSAIVIFRGELQSLASWRRWAMRLGAVVSLLWILFYVMAVYSSCSAMINPGALVSLMSVPYLLFRAC